MGFNIRKNNIRYDTDGETNVSYWVCNREYKAAMRVKCPAAFRVGMNKKCGTWVVNKFKFL